MTKKATKAAANAPTVRPDGLTQDEFVLRLSASPLWRCAEELLVYGCHRKEDLPELFKELQRVAVETGKGKLNRATEMLVAQAHLMDALMQHQLLRAAQVQPLDSVASERLLERAMAAQEQSRRCWETVAQVQSRPTAV